MKRFKRYQMIYRYMTTNTMKTQLKVCIAVYAVSLVLRGDVYNTLALLLKANSSVYSLQLTPHGYLHF